MKEEETWKDRNIRPSKFDCPICYEPFDDSEIIVL